MARGHTVGSVFGVVTGCGLATLLCACGEVNGSTTSVHASSGGADGGVDHAPPEGAGGIGTGGAGTSGTGGRSAVLDAGASALPDSGRRSVSDSSVPLEASPPPAAIAARQTVTFEIRNDTGADRYLVTAGNDCTTFDVYSLPYAGAAQVLQALGFSCPCECPSPGQTAPTRLHRLAPGETMSISWDARALVTWLAGVECSFGSGPPSGHSSALMGVRQPVSAGHYSVVVGVEPTLPPACTGVGPDFDCRIQYGAGGGPSLASLCPTSNTARAEFDLPSTGDVIIPVDLR